MAIKSFFKAWVAYALLAFPMFYFVYKYGTPDLGLKDFYDYYKLYSNWDIANVDAPFNMRLLSSFFVFLFNKLGFNYHTHISFIKAGYDQQVFFNAILFNFLCIIATCVVIFNTCHKQSGNVLLSFIGGLLYLLGFGTIFFEYMPITDALSILLFALVLNSYLAEKYSIIFYLVLLIFQREYVFLALGLICLLDYWKYRRKYFLHILLAAIGCFGIYYLLRKTLFYTPTYDHQASPGYFLDSLVHLKFPLGSYIKQTVMTLNVFILYLFIVFYKKMIKMKADNFELVKLLLLFVQINVISFAAVFGNNTGRYFYILIPLIIYQLIKEVEPLVSKHTTI